MSSIFAMLIAGLPKALMAISAKIFTEMFFQKILEKIIIFALEKAVSLTTNKIDDEVVEDIKRKLQASTAP